MSDIHDAPESLVHLESKVRSLGATLAELGWDRALHQLVVEIPDARDRLRYVGQMTEDAANKVLNMVDETQPTLHQKGKIAAKMADRLAVLAADPTLTLEQARAAMLEIEQQLRAAQDLANKLAETMTSIMLAQDFQDLSGQVIKKVVGIISHTEEQLLRLLAQSEGQVAQPPLANAALAGPQVPDKAVSQADVDDLLASMDF